MNKIDESEWMADFRASVPFPSQARLVAGRARLLAAVTGQGQADDRHRAAAARAFLRWRPMVALAAATAIAVSVSYALTASAGRPAQTTVAGRATRPGMKARQAMQLPTDPQALLSGRAPSSPKGTLILSTALTQVSEVAAPGDR